MAVTRQKNKKWKVDLSDGYDAITGGQKRHRKTNFKSRKEAERYEADYRINNLEIIVFVMVLLKYGETFTLIHGNIALARFQLSGKNF